MLYNGVEVQTIKLVLSGTESTGISSKQVLLNCIVYLTEKYRESREFSYLEKAVCIFGIGIFLCRRRRNFSNSS